MATQLKTGGWLSELTGVTGASLADWIRRSVLGEQQRFVVASAVKDMHDFDRFGTDAIENQETAKRAHANAELLVARHQ